MVLPGDPSVRGGSRRPQPQIIKNFAFVVAKTNPDSHSYIETISGASSGRFDRWYLRLVKYVVGAMGRSDLAEDPVQDEFMQLYQILRSGNNIEYPNAWTLFVLRRAVNPTSPGQKQRRPNSSSGSRALNLGAGEP